ncbi:MAG: hypothetical protein COW30_11245 [Rhodospirillales bacterium CG15_BIG_FIL_POST_REV_8_21_14_020_66_15]|nr:MAG: hypothetical protein COW30_11245 [Rhodospirillales bacterium CG15_BIG_FIL_POST_REV_8_21_14_020_66_15]
MAAPTSAEKTKALLTAAGDPSKTMPLGAMGLDQQGQLVRKNDDGLVEFTFRYMGYQFAVRAEVHPGHTRMRIHAVLGHLPYTAEARELRTNMRAVVHEAGRALGGRIHINPEQRILFLDEFNFDETLTPGSLLTKTVAFLLSAKPYLELLSLIAGASKAVYAMLPAPQAKAPAE